MIRDLGEAHPDLEGILLIEGVGLTSNVYAILGRRIAIIDTGGGPPENSFLSQLQGRGIDPDTIHTVVITHAHSDHTGGLVEFKQRNDFRVRIHPAGIALIPPGLKVESLKDNESIHAGHLTLKVLYTPGHSVGSICLYSPARQILFSGDTVFPGGSFGRTDLPTGNDRKIIASLEKLSQLPVKHLLAGHEPPVIGEGLVHLKASLKSAVSLLSDRI